jgi:alkylated DNA repair dioxygenase AlkB
MESFVNAPLLNARYFPDAVPDADATFARLLAVIEWDDRMASRRTASFGRPYNYSDQVYPAAPMPPPIEVVAAHASALAGHGFDNCLCNLYETGDSSMGFHRDAYDELDKASFIAIVSFGAPRSLEFRGADRSRTDVVRLAHGSILLMDRATQEHWKHAVRREPGAGRRISLTFRRFDVAEDDRT